LISATAAAACVVVVVKMELSGCSGLVVGGHVQGAVAATAAIELLVMVVVGSAVGEEAECDDAWLDEEELRNARSMKSWTRSTR
jgi:hypothetical protein